MIRAAVERGITFSTPPKFTVRSRTKTSGRRSARTVSRSASSSRRSSASKDGNSKNGLDSRPEHIRAVADASLKRLRTDRIDLFYQHRVDPSVPIEEVAGAVHELIAEGKVRHFGLSEAGVADDPPRPHGAARCGPSERIFVMVARARERDVAARWKNSASASCPSARSARASSRAPSDENDHVRQPRISATPCRVFAPEARKANQAIVDALGEIARAQARIAGADRARMAARAEAVDRADSRHDQTPSARGKRRGRRRSNSRRTTCATSRMPFPKSPCRAHGIRSISNGSSAASASSLQSRSLRRAPRGDLGVLVVDESGRFTHRGIEP